MIYLKPSSEGAPKSMTRKPHHRYSETGPGETGRLTEDMMIRLIAVTGFALSIATSTQAMTPAPFPQPQGVITQAALACGAGRTRVNGVCVARTTIRHTRRAVRRCATGMTC